MELLESYLKAVRRYLPRRHRDDIIAELLEELRLQMEAREAQLGRPLRDAEQMALLKGYGDPMTVARRYRQKVYSLNIGWELIGPELFPMFLLILGFNLVVALGVNCLIVAYLRLPFRPMALVRLGILQVIVVTLMFTILNLIRRRHPQPWYYPPAGLAPMIPIARGYSISGICIWVLFTAWWALLPLFPRLLLGSAALYLELGPAWHRFYWVILLLLAGGVVQRAINLARPAWTWLLPTTRLVINAVALGLQYPMIRSFPYMLVGQGAADPVHARRVADTFNGTILWGVLSWMWAYHLVGAAIYAWYCAPHIGRLLRRKEPAIHVTQEINGIL